MTGRLFLILNLMKMTKQEVINELETILQQTRLSPRAGKYEALKALDWFWPSAGRVLSRLWNGLKSDGMAIIQAAKFVWNGPELDPKRHATEPPKWWHGNAKPVEIPEQEDYFKADRGRFCGLGLMGR